MKSVLLDRKGAVQFYNSGLDGLQAVREEKFDLIICGTDLPVITGFELIRSLRTHSTNRVTPVIMITEELYGKSERLARTLEVMGTVPQCSIDHDLDSLVTSALNGWKWVDLLGHRYDLSPN